MMGKSIKRKSCKTAAKRRQSLAITLSVVLLVYMAIGGTLAYLVIRTASLENTFVPASVTCSVNVNGDEMAVQNTGNVDAYIRAAIVVNWTETNGDAVYGLAPDADDYAVAINASTNWEDAQPWYLDTSTGFYYYKLPVASLATTPLLVTDITVLGTPPAGYALSVEVVAEAIQADGDTDVGSIPAVEDAWKVSFYNG